MKKIVQHLFPLSFMLVFPLLGLVYAKLNTAPVNANNVLTSLDTFIPFKEVFIIPYLLWFPFTFLCLIYFYIKDKRLYHITLASDVIGRCICFVIYYFFQTTVPRPEVIGDDVFSGLVRWIYSTDSPTNCFPSIHCLTTFLMMRAINSSTFKNRKNVYLINTIGISIIFSTLFIKQHAVIDALSGMLLAHMVFTVLSLLTERKSSLFQKRFQIGREKMDI